MHRLQIRPIVLRGHPYHSCKLHLGWCGSVGMRRGTERQRHTDTQMAEANIRFAWAMLHEKCNEMLMFIHYIYGISWT